ncbi:MAG: adenylate/guanylate cyclase domain-containing protein [Chitinophagales bacterium]
MAGVKDDLQRLEQQIAAASSPEEAYAALQSALVMREKHGASVKFSAPTPAHPEEATKRYTAWAQLILTQCYFQISEFEICRERYTHNIHVFEQLGDIEGRCDALDGLGGSLLRMGDNEGALQYLELALEGRRKLNGKGIDTTLLFLGNVYYRTGQYDKALYYYRQAPVNQAGSPPSVASASLQNNIGLILATSGQYEEALRHFQLAAAMQQQLGEYLGWADARLNIGNIYFHLGDWPQALAHFIETLKITRNSNNKKVEASALNNIGCVYLVQNDDVLAEENFQEALTIRREINDKRGISSTLNELGKLALKQQRYVEALQYYTEALEIRIAINDQRGISITQNSIGEVYRGMGNYDAAIHHHQMALHIAREIGLKAKIAESLCDLGRCMLSTENRTAAFPLLQEAIDIANSTGDKAIQRDANQLLYQFYQQKNEWRMALEHFERFVQLKDDLANIESAKQIISLKASYDLELKQKENELIESILHNMLPGSIVQRIKQGEEKIIEKFDSASVLFADIVAFSSWSSHQPVGDVAEMLDTLFHLFDALAPQFGVEKIKTIGDSYMCVAGLPERCNDHAPRLARMALAMMQAMEEFSKRYPLQLRIGLHSGEVIAGIIGKNKYSYDLWGDTVNTASRMESHSASGKIQVTDAFKQLCTSQFGFEPRGEVMIKGRGAMNTYFLTHYIP